MDNEHNHFLATPEGFADYLSEVFKSNDFIRVRESTARAVCWNRLSDFAAAAGVTRASLYRDYVGGVNHHSKASWPFSMPWGRALCPA